MYVRSIYHSLKKRVEEPRRFIQVLAGPRQVGKTMLGAQLKEALAFPVHYASADEPTLRDITWIEQQWEIGRLRVREHSSTGALLILDEIQKIPSWSERIKYLWDQDTAQKLDLKVMILGSSRLLIERGLTESLAGRFEITPITHWSFSDCKNAFGWTLNQYLYFGGYPGAAPLIEDETRWSQYVRHALIETTISRDIMLMTQIHKPALLRRLFELGCRYSGQILSYQKMLGQLQDTGNATTLAHYLDLLSSAGLITGIQKFSLEVIRQKASSPKLQVLNTALMNASASLSFQAALQESEQWGRLTESAVGAHLINSCQGTTMEVFYWREGNKEVDFILKKGDHFIPIEVKSSQRRTSLPGIEAFSKYFAPQKKLLVGGQGIPIEEFLLRSPETFF